MEKVDYKKIYKDLYLPKTTPELIEVPRMNFVAVSGKGNPNEENGEYQKAMQILYGVSFTIKMSKMKMGTEPIDGYFDYVVPPLEGLWNIDLNEIKDFGIADKSQFEWISMIRLPEFVDEAIFLWAQKKLKEKHPEIDLKNTHFLTLEEGLCAQVMHKGPYDEEQATISLLQQFIENNGYVEDFNLEKHRYHHEIYLGDPRRTKPENLRTVIRHPIKKVTK